MACVKAELAKETKEAAELLEQALEICQEPDGPGFYLDLLESEKAAVERAQKAECFREWKDLLETIEFKRLPAGKKGRKMNRFLQKDRSLPRTSEARQRILSKNFRNGILGKPWRNWRSI